MSTEITKDRAYEILEKQFYSETIPYLVENEFDKYRSFIDKWCKVMICNRVNDLTEYNVVNLLSLMNITKSEIFVEKIELDEEIIKSITVWRPNIIFLKINNTNEILFFREDKKDILNYKSLFAEKSKSEKVKSEKKFLTYIMIDKNLPGFYKIGKAINPKYREKTLQGEKPTISLIYICNENIESKLHSLYKHKRVRGEWFKLTDDEISNIVLDYKFQSKENINLKQLNI
jgi:hypothetical protein